MTTTPPAVKRTRLTVRAKLRRARIKGRHDAVADAHRTVAVTERQIIGPGGGDFLVAEDPGRAQRTNRN